MSSRALRWTASGLGLGYLPVAPGTWGSLGGIALWWFTLPLGIWMQVMLLALVMGPAAWVCGACARQSGQSDPSFIVLDEILGMYLALLFLAPSWIGAGAAFAVFRVLDILKPWPVSQMETRFRAGPAILLDDLVAGALAGSIVLFIQYITRNI